MNLALLDERSLRTIWLAARKYTGDDDAAWDCVQEALATALVSDRGLDARETVPWLCGVARNHARHWVRGNARHSQAIRRMAERAPARKGSVDPVALRDALAGLPAKQRDAVVLRYLTGRSFAEVADAQRISEAAAKARVRRGLAALRARFGGASLALLLARESSAGGFGALASAAAGISMKKTITLLLVLLTLVGVGIPVFSTVLEPEPTRDRAVPGKEGEDAGMSQPPSAAPETAAARASDPSIYPATRARAVLSGAVVDLEGAVVPGATVSIRSTNGGMNPLMTVGDDRSIRQRLACDENGAFEVTVPEGAYVLAATAETGVSAETEVMAPAASPVRLTLKPRVPHELLVNVEDVEARPVGNATVALTFIRKGDARERSAVANTGADGVCEFDAGELVAADVDVAAPNGLVGRARFGERRQGRTVRVVVDRAGSITGSIVGVPADRLGRVTVVAHANPGSNAYMTHHGPEVSAVARDGRYRIDGLAAGHYDLSIRSDSGLRLRLEPYIEWNDPVPNAVRLASAEVAAGATTTRDLAVTIGGRVAGRVTTGGLPVAGARVQATFAPMGGNVSDGFRLHGVHVWRLDAQPHHWRVHPEVQRRALTDADGRYALDGLHPGVHRVEVAADGLGYDRRMDVSVSDGTTTELRHELRPAGVLQLVGDTSYVGVSRAGETTPLWIAIVGRLGATVGGLAAGEYEVAAFHSDASRGRAPLARVRVEAGRTTWVDLRGEGPVRIRGRVLGAAGPIVGASVSAGALPWIRTGPGGEFEFRAAFAWSGFVSFRVALDGVVWVVPFPPMSNEETEWEGELRLGGHSVTVRALDASGAPTAARVNLQAVVRGNPVDGIARVQSSRVPADRHGDAGIRHLSPGMYTGQVEFASGLHVPIAVEVPRSDPIEVREPPLASLRVTVKDSKGRAFSGAAVAVHVWTSDGEAPSDIGEFLKGSLRVDGRTDEAGVANFAKMASGPAWVVASRTGFAIGPRPTARDSVRIHAGGEHELALVLRRE